MFRGNDFVGIYNNLFEKWPLIPSHKVYIFVAVWSVFILIKITQVWLSWNYIKCHVKFNMKNYILKTLLACSLKGFRDPPNRSADSLWGAFQSDIRSRSGRGTPVNRFEWHLSADCPEAVVIYRDCQQIRGFTFPVHRNTQGNKQFRNCQLLWV